MRDEFIISRQGKDYVLFAGLLDEAHERGLKKIDTDLIQVPSDQNYNVAIVKATVEMEDGSSFSGIGDASTENVNRNIAKHIIRMAETRAKARALRDAVNVGVTAFEELADDDSPASSAQAGDQVAQRREKAKQERQSRPRVEDAPNTSKGGASAARKYKMRKNTRDLLAAAVKDWKGVETNREVLAILDKLAETKALPLSQWTDEQGVAVAASIQQKIDKRTEKETEKEAAEEVDDLNGLGETSRQHGEEVEEDDDEIDLDDDLEEIRSIAGGVGAGSEDS